MADSAIGSLPAVQTMTNADLFVLEQNGAAMKLSGELLASFIDRQIVSISVVERDATADYTCSYNSETGELVIGVPRGVGIASISNPVVSGLNKTYTITWEKPYGASTATAKQFTVKDGNAITSIEAIDEGHEHGSLDQYRINFSEGDPFDFYVYNGADGYGTPGTAVPLMDGTAAVGTANMYARQDHVHPTDTSRQAKIYEVTVNISASATEAQIGSLTDSRIDANTYVVQASVSDSSVQVGDWTISTYNSAPQLRVTGISLGTTAMRLLLAEVV